MKLKGFMDDAYQGKTRNKKLNSCKSDIIFSLDDLADRVGMRPSKADIERLVPKDERLLDSLVKSDPGKKYQQIWGILTSIAAEQSPEPLRLKTGNFVGLELSGGTVILEQCGDHVGERMSGGRIFIKGDAGDYLGQEMSGGGIVAGSCKDYAFRNMHAGWGVIFGNAGKYTGVGNSGGRIAVRGNSGERSGWLMRKGHLRIRGDAGDYLGLLMSGGEIIVIGRTGKRAGWRMKSGVIKAESYGPEAGDGSCGGSILGLDS